MLLSKIYYIFFTYIYYYLGRTREATLLLGHQHKMAAVPHCGKTADCRTPSHNS